MLGTRPDQQKDKEQNGITKALNAAGHKKQGGIKRNGEWRRLLEETVFFLLLLLFLFLLLVLIFLVRLPAAR